MIEKTGNPEGILFLDEVNCVSETLAPAMLQFLQYKVFARHRIPDGWIVVTAGNPPSITILFVSLILLHGTGLKELMLNPIMTLGKNMPTEAVFMHRS